MVPCSALISSKLIDQRVLVPTKSAASSIVAIKASSHLKGEKISKSSFLMIVMAACWIKMARIRREDLSAWLSYLYFKFHCLERWAIADISIWGRVGCGGGFKKCVILILFFFIVFIFWWQKHWQNQISIWWRTNIYWKSWDVIKIQDLTFGDRHTIKGQRNWKRKSENSSDCPNSVFTAKEFDFTETYRLLAAVIWKSIWLASDWFCRNQPVCVWSMKR